jgi:hypothetical protein
VFIIRFFTGSILGILSGIVLGLVLIAVILGILTTALMATGGPDACEPASGAITVSQANSDSFIQKWDAFDQALNNGTPGVATFNESEIASRAESWANEKDVPFEDIRACLYDGYGEASATVRVLGMDVKVRVKGTLDLSGDNPEAKVDDISVGNVPGFLMAPVEFVVDRALDDGLDDLEIEHDYSLTLKEGEATIGGKP